MGGRGASINVGTQAVSLDYEPLTYGVRYGQVTKFEAGVLYKATKEGNITPMRETVSLFYDEAKAPIYLAGQRYNQDRFYYDDMYQITQQVLNKNYKKAQGFIDKFQKSLIERAGKKSPYFKYK